MATTYTQIHIQGIFAVQSRECIIQNNWRDELYKYITGVIKNNKHKPIVINGSPDHIHVLFGMRPSQSLADLMQDIKSNSSRWINEKRFLKGRFQWQEGFGAFSYGKSQLSDVIKYINNQEEHHKKRTFIEEYKELLRLFEVEYDEKYIFKPVE